MKTEIIAEIGQNHNGNLEIAKKLIDAACLAGCDYVKFQKRTIETGLYNSGTQRETPWGILDYAAYRKRLEFGRDEYDEIDKYCKSKNILWFASAWDLPAVDFIDSYNPPFHKIPSAKAKDREFIEYVAHTKRRVILSTGGCNFADIHEASGIIARKPLVIMHCVSMYPCKPEHLNLNVIKALRRDFSHPSRRIGYSGHEVGLATTVAAVALGATMIERHITLDRSMWGSDQAASIEPIGLLRLVRYIRTIEKALGNGVKRIYPEEVEKINNLNMEKPENDLLNLKVKSG